MNERLDRDLERLAFAALLDVYAAPRPRAARDRRWLEGYCEACETVRRVARLITVQARQSVAREMIRSFRSTMDSRVAPQFSHLADNGFLSLSNAQKGHCDAWLDSVGC